MSPDTDHNLLSSLSARSSSLNPSPSIEISVSPRHLKSTIVAAKQERHIATNGSKSPPPSSTRRIGVRKSSFHKATTAHFASPLDKARHQWQKHKRRVEGCSSGPKSDEEILIKVDKSRSRSKSPEQCPMYGGEALHRSDHRPVALVGTSVPSVDTTNSLGSTSRASGRSKMVGSVVEGGSSQEEEANNMDQCRDDISNEGSAQEDNTDTRQENDIDNNNSLLEYQEIELNPSMSDEGRESGCVILFDGLAGVANKTLSSVVTKTREPCSSGRLECEQIAKVDIGGTEDVPQRKTNKKETGGGGLSLAASFATNDSKAVARNAAAPPPPDLLPPPKTSVGGSLLQRLGKLCEGGICSPSSFLTGLCSSPPESPDRNPSTSGEDTERQELTCTNLDTSTSLVTKNFTASIRSKMGIQTIVNGCAAPGLAAINLIPSSDGDNVNRNEDSKKQGEGAGLTIRESFSFLSPKLSGVGWPVNVDDHGRRTVKRRNGALGSTEAPKRGPRPFKVAVLDNRLGPSSPASPVHRAEVTRDPGLLAKSHFTGWDGKRSHYTVLTPPPTTTSSANKTELSVLGNGQMDEGCGVLDQLAAVPGTLAFSSAVPEKNSRTPRWQSPGVMKKLEGVDAVIHLISAPPHDATTSSSSPRRESSGTDTDDEEVTLDDIIGGSFTTFGFMSATFDDASTCLTNGVDSVDDGDEEEEQSFAPSTVASVEDRVIKNFLGSSDSDDEESRSAIGKSSTNTARVEPSPKPPRPPNTKGRPPLLLNRAPPPMAIANRARADTLNSYASSQTSCSRNSKISAGSFHRRQNSAVFFSPGQLSQIVEIRSPKRKTKKIASPTIKEVDLSKDEWSNVSPMAGSNSPLQASMKGKGAKSVKGMKTKNSRKDNNGGTATKKKKEHQPKKKSKFAFWQQPGQGVSVDLFGSKASSGTDGGFVHIQGGDSVSTNDHVQGLVPTSRAASPPPRDVDARAYLLSCPMFRRTLRSVSRRKIGSTMFEAWVGFSKGDRLLHRLKASHENGLAREDLRYVLLSNGELPTVHIFTSKRDEKDSGRAKIASVEHLVLTKHMRVETFHVSNKYGRCVAIVDCRNGKIIATIVPVLLKPQMFTADSKACLVSEKKYERMGGGLALSPLVEEVFPGRRGLQTHTRKDSRTSKTSSATNERKRKVWGTPDNWVEFAPDGQHDATMHALFAFDTEIKKAARRASTKKRESKDKPR